MGGYFSPPIQVAVWGGPLRVTLEAYGQFILWQSIWGVLSAERKKEKYYSVQWNVKHHVHSCHVCLFFSQHCEKVLGAFFIFHAAKPEAAMTFKLHKKQEPSFLSPATNTVWDLVCCSLLNLYVAPEWDLLSRTLILRCLRASITKKGKTKGFYHGHCHTGNRRRDLGPNSGGQVQ